MSTTTQSTTVNHGREYVRQAETHMEFHSCGECGILFGFPTTFSDQRQKDGKSWYCPNGHNWHWNPGPSKAELLRQERERSARLQARLDQERAHASAMKGVATRERNKRQKIELRVANGVCPCCGRTFKQLARHMKTKHPDYVAEAGAE